jgi:predicted metal-dependent HD superfamily phosphohydrolase
MAAAHPIPSFLQLPIEALAEEEAAPTEQARPRSAALARGASLRLTQAVRIEPGLAEAERVAADAPADGSARPVASAQAMPAAQQPAVVERAGRRTDARPAARFDREATLAVWREWLRTWEINSDPAPAIDLLAERLSDPRRHFHNLARVAAELRWLDTWRDKAQDPVALGFAIWFRYAVVDPSRCDNEARSAEFARIALAGLGVDGPRIRRVRELVLSMREGAIVGTPDARLLFDIGRAWLAELPAILDDLEENLRAESVHVVDAIYWRRRAAAIRAMLIKPRVYLSDVARARLEASARGNLSRRLEGR